MTVSVSPLVNSGWTRRINWALLTLACVTVLILGHAYGTRYYIAWEDETMFAEIAETFHDRGILGAPSFEGNGLKMAERTYFMPPLYPLFLSQWFHIFPSTLANARLFSNALAVLCLVGVFGIATRIGARGIASGCIALALAVDVQFASMFTWARPDMLACTLSILAVWTYMSPSNKDHMSLSRLAVAYMLATAGMLTHPIGGMIGFLTIPLHMLISKSDAFRQFKVWVVLVGIPILGLCLWGLYISQDLDTFRHQFIDWQIARKSGRFAGVREYAGILVSSILNFGVKGDGLAGTLSTVLVCLCGLKALGERDRSRPGLLVILLVVLSGLAVNYGREGAYPPLRLPPFYLALAICIDSPLHCWPCAKMRRTGFLSLRYAPLIAAVLALLLAKSALATAQLVKEITKSERAAAYCPSTLAEEITTTIPQKSSLGISVFPDCFDILSHSHHFQRVNRLAWTRLSPDQLVDYVVSRNDYLAITDSVLEPRLPGHRIDFTERCWGSSGLRELASRFYILQKTIVLPGGGETKIYKRDPNKVPEDTARRLADPQH